MNLPEMRYKEQRVRETISAFGGLDRTDGAGDGYLTGTVNLSARRYPYLSPRSGRQTRSVHVRPTALYAWGDLVLVDGTDLIYKGEKVGTVSEGAKQFAVVNTRLVIWPDKVALDMESGELTDMDPAVTPVGTAMDPAVVMTTDSISAAAYPRVAVDVEQTGYIGFADRWNPLIYVYGKDKEAVDACWDAAAGAWDMDKLGKLEELVGPFGIHDAEKRAEWGVKDYGYMQAGMIFIPSGGKSFCDGSLHLYGEKAGT